MRAPVQFPPDRRPAKPLADASCCASMQRSENKKLDYKKLSKSRKSVDFSYILVCQGWSLKSTCGFRWHHCHGRVGTERVTTNLKKICFVKRYLSIITLVLLPTWGVARRVRTYRCPIETGWSDSCLDALGCASWETTNRINGLNKYGCKRWTNTVVKVEQILL